MLRSLERKGQNTGANGTRMFRGRKEGSLLLQLLHRKRHSIRRRLRNESSISWRMDDHEDKATRLGPTKLERKEIYERRIRIERFDLIIPAKQIPSTAKKSYLLIFKDKILVLTWSRNATGKMHQCHYCPVLRRESRRRTKAREALPELKTAAGVLWLLLDRRQLVARKARCRSHAAAPFIVAVIVRSSLAKEVRSSPS
nr:hypothetical protein Iba_chr05cCG11460 [Ipomoea batatas]